MLISAQLQQNKVAITKYMGNIPLVGTGGNKASDEVSNKGRERK